EGIVPDGSTLSVDPVSTTLTNVTVDTAVDFKVIARYADGSPIPYAKVKIEGSFAAPNAVNAYQFYYYPGGAKNPNNVAVDSGFTGQTDEFGIYRFSANVFGSATGFNDDINISSGTASTKATLILEFK
nr:hypothetical protein [Nitrospiraceae bacterium]